MRSLAMIFCSLAILSACKKTKDILPITPSIMKYTNLHDSVVSFNKSASFDLDGDGEKDVRFATLLVGDPIAKQDKMQWYVASFFHSSLPVNNEEKIPVLNNADNIPIGNFSGYNWYNASAIVLAQKIITEQTTYWEGDWKDVNHRFIPLQVKKNNALYNGWVEISFNKEQEQIILHKAAISNNPNQNIKAGN